MKIYDDIRNQLLACTRPGQQRPFFLFAGAGSGKTRMLTTLLERILEEQGAELAMQSKRIAVITFTNAAVDVINRRIHNNPIVQVSTIHSFLWALIETYQRDIKRTLLRLTKEKLEELRKQTKKWTKSKELQQDKLLSKLSDIEQATRFTYFPDSKTIGTLQHDDVIAVGSYLLSSAVLLQQIMKQRYPIVLIDESQDTDKRLIKALESTLRENDSHFTLGLIGDIKQRIYAAGDETIGTFSSRVNCEIAHLPMNFRCPKRMVKLANLIAKEIDEEGEQETKGDAAEGIIRFFIAPHSSPTQQGQLERKLCEQMAVFTSDTEWNSQTSVCSLVLEHRMAAIRTGCADLYDALCISPQYKQKLTSGNIAEVNFFTQQVWPLLRDTPHFDIAIHRHLQRYCPLFLEKNPTWDWNSIRETIKSACNELKNCAKNGSIYEVLHIISKHKLLKLPPYLDIAMQLYGTQHDNEADTENEADTAIHAWKKALAFPFSQIQHLNQYVNRKSGFYTHQGVKGEEFPRVLVIIDDTSSKGFLFSYDKALGIKEKTAIDIRHEQEGKDTTIARTLRLLYVTCTRATKSLALICYSDNPSKLKSLLLRKEFFTENEVILL